LGVSCDYHDAAAAVCVDGTVIAAAAEERFTRVKHDRRLPVHAIRSCLQTAGLHPDDLAAVVFYEKPLNVVARFLAAQRSHGPGSLGTFARDLPVLVSTNLMVGDRIERALRSLGATRSPNIAYSDHHLSHAAAAFFPSPFDDAAILTVDGVGEWATTTIGRGTNGTIDVLEEQRFPHSLGLLYSLVTRWCGFEPNDGEYKLMGLAPYGEPTFVPALEQLIDLHDDGGFTIRAGAVGWWSTPVDRLVGVAQLLGGPARPTGAPVTQREADLAASVQILTERALLGLGRRARLLTNSSRLCIAGGVALNCVAVGRLIDRGVFDEVWVQPAAGDAGSAVGAALAWTFQHGYGERGSEPPDATGDGMSAGCLGPAFPSDDVERWLQRRGVPYRRFDSSTERADMVAARLADGDVIGWFEGRMEFGPRALGHRSILADPRSIDAQTQLNSSVKGREDFRPFAPAVLAEAASEWFDLDHASPYMLRTAPVHEAHRNDVADEASSIAERVRTPRSAIPACTHVDFSARVQTVEAESHPAFHELLTSFAAITRCPVLVNTSFNRAGEPIVCTPSDALRTARRAELDLVVLDDLVVEGADIPVTIDAPDDPDTPWRSGSPSDPRIVTATQARRRARLQRLSTFASAVVLLPLWVFVVLVPWMMHLRRPSRSAVAMHRRTSTALVDGRLWSPDPTSEPLTWISRWRRTPQTVPPQAMADVTWWDEYRSLIRWYQTDGFDTLRFRRQADLTSPLINVVDGRRVSWRPPAEASPRLRVWCYGGSAMFGFGQRDACTIASYLSQVAFDHGIVVDVENRGVTGDTHWVEAQRFAWDVAAETPPDLVLFYDGFNELLATHNINQSDRALDGDPVDITMGDLSDGMDRFRRAVLRMDGVGPPSNARLLAQPTAPTTDDVTRLAAVTAERFERSRSVSAAISAAHHIPVCWFWQPTRLTRRPVAGEPAAGEPHEEWSRTLVSAVRSLLHPAVVDLGSLLDAHDEPMFYDDVHHNELGAQRIAAAIYDHIAAHVARTTDIEP
ncbi:MAG: carbamoyltransferase N-terminal domain-containing protein, partial [Actinomycetes bacterium]